jgi:hypothetical protein
VPRSTNIHTANASIPDAPRRPRRMVLGPPGWLTAADIIERGLAGSQTSLDRLLARAANDNPFPEPARDAISRVRFWREGDVTLWVELERQHRERRLLQPDPRGGGAQRRPLEAAEVVS